MATTAVDAVDAATPQVERPRRRPPRHHRAGAAAWTMLAPNLLLLALFLFGPLLWAFAMSFQAKRSFGPGEWSGLDNFVRLVGDDVFWRALLNTAIFTVATVPVGVLLGLALALLNTAIFTVATVPVGVLLGLALALLMDKAMPARGFFRTVVYLPIVLSTLVVSLVGLLMFDESIGIINGILADVGIGDVAWQSDGRLAMTSVVLMTLWTRIGFSMLVYIAALQDVDPEVVEAARVDGASGFDVVRHVVVPSLRPSTFFLVVVNMIWSFQVFDIVYVMTNGGPGYSTTMLVTYAYDEGFGPARNFGYGSAIGVVLFLITVVITLVQVRRGRAEVA